jgi:hypothetical protein
VFVSESATTLTVFVTWRKTLSKLLRTTSQERQRLSARRKTTAPFGTFFDLPLEWELVWVSVSYSPRQPGERLAPTLRKKHRNSVPTPDNTLLPPICERLARADSGSPFCPVLGFTL